MIINYKNKEQDINDIVYNFIVDTNISSEEREIFINFKDSSDNEARKIEALKSKLNVLAINKKLSPSVVEFYLELSRRTAGNKSIGSLFNNFIKK